MKPRIFYAVNGDNNCSYTARNAASVASVAMAWKRNGRDPHAFAIVVGERVTSQRATITTVRGTAAALRVAAHIAANDAIAKRG